jgi:hypothetical protein
MYARVHTAVRNGAGRAEGRRSEGSDVEAAVATIRGPGEPGLRNPRRVADRAVAAVEAELRNMTTSAVRHPGILARDEQFRHLAAASRVQCYQSRASVRFLLARMRRERSP